MNRYVFSLIRCVPDPRTGEFINVGAIAGEAESQDWSLRQVSNESRFRKLAVPEVLDAVHGFMTRLGVRVDEQQSFFSDEPGILLDEQALVDLSSRMRNVVQLTRPAPIMAESAEAALDVIFGQLIIDPVSQPRGFIAKSRVFAEARAAYAKALPPVYIHPRVEIFVGESVRAPIDFSIGGERTLQVSQCWSFQRAGTSELSTELKSWGYALTRLRGGDGARIIDASNRIMSVTSDIEIDAIVAGPRTAAQRDVFEEATQIWSDLNVRVTTFNDVQSVARRAAELVGAGAADTKWG